MTATGGETAPGSPSASCRVRAVLDRIGDKWAIYVVDRLGGGPRRFSELLRGIDGITARMLTVTLRGLERDGILTRTVHAAVPPRVDYALTPLGETLLRRSGTDAGTDLREAAGRHDVHLPEECERPRARGRPRRAVAPASQAAPRAYSASPGRAARHVGFTGSPHLR